MLRAGLPRSMPNASQCLSMPIKIMALIRNASQCRSLPINARILIGIDRHWALIEGVLIMSLIQRHDLSISFSCSRPIMFLMRNMLNQISLQRPINLFGLDCRFFRVYCYHAHAEGNEIVTIYWFTNEHEEINSCHEMSLKMTCLRIQVTFGLLIQNFRAVSTCNNSYLLTLAT